MTDINTAILDFYNKHGFGNELGKRPSLTVKVYTGCMLVPLPNIETRRKYLKYHDLHHIITGYSVGRIGEGKMSAWELGTGTFYRYPVLGFMNLIALSTGLFLSSKDMWSAFLLGKRSKNIYKKEMRQSIDNNNMQIEELRNQVLGYNDSYKPNFFTKIEFYFYCTAAMIVHAMLVLPAIIVRLITDFIDTGSVIETIRPKKRADLF